METAEIIKMAEDIAKYTANKYINGLKRPHNINANDVMCAMGIASGILGYSLGSAMEEEGAKAYSVGDKR